MKSLAILGALIATGAYAQSASPRAKGAADPNEMICRTIALTGSRLRHTRVCMTRAEWAEQLRITRHNVERAQTIRVERD